MSYTPPPDPHEMREQEPAAAQEPHAETSAQLKFIFISTHDLKAMVIPPVPWLIEGVFPAALVSTIVGASGAGKTWACLSLLRAWATGEAWLGKYAARKLRAAFLDAEDDWATCKQRWEQLEAGMGELPDDAELPQWLSDIGAFDVLEPAAHLGLLAALKAFDVVIVDSLAQSHTYDENSTDMRTVMQQWESISRATGCAVILAHHSGWDKTRGRGSSAIKDRSQAQLMVNRDAELPLVYLKLDKAKRGPEIPRVATLRIEGTWDGPVRIEVIDEQQQAQGADKSALTLKAQALALVERRLKGLEMAQKDVAASMQEELNVSHGKAYALLRAFIEEGVLVQRAQGRAQWVRLA